MSLFHPDIRSLKVHNAIETAFGVDEGSFSGRSIRLTTQPNLALSQDLFPDPTIRQRISRVKNGILGLKKATLSFTCFLRSTGTAAGDATPALGAADLAECQLLENCLGGEILGTGTTVNDASATVDGLTVTSAAGLTIGQAVMIGGEATVIKTISTNDITFVRALSAAPANATVVYAAASYFPEQVADSGTLQFQCKGAEDDYWSMLGSQGSMKIAGLTVGELPTVTFEFQGASWSAFTSAAIAPDTYLNTINPPAVGYSSAAYCQTYGTKTLNRINATAITIDPSVAYDALNSVSGVMGIQNYIRSSIGPTVEFTTEYADTWRDAFEAQTYKYFHLQIGSTPGNTVLIDIPKFYIGKSVERGAYNSQLGVKVSGQGVSDIEAAALLIRQASVRVHLL